MTLTKEMEFINIKRGRVGVKVDKDEIQLGLMQWGTDERMFAWATLMEAHKFCALILKACDVIEERNKRK